MNRGIWLVVLLVCLVAAGLSVARPWDKATAQEQRVIPLSIYSHRDNADGALADGDTCGWSLGTIDILWADPQVIVRNEVDAIVAMVTLKGGSIRQGELPQSVFCELELEVPVPDASYYTVFLASLEEIRVMGYSADDFPIETLAPVSIDPDFD